MCLQTALVIHAHTDALQINLSFVVAAIIKNVFMKCLCCSTGF